MKKYVGFRNGYVRVRIYGEQTEVFAYWHLKMPGNEYVNMGVTIIMCFLTKERNGRNAVLSLKRYTHNIAMSLLWVSAYYMMVKHGM